MFLLGFLGVGETQNSELIALHGSFHFELDLSSEQLLKLDCPQPLSSIWLLMSIAQHKEPRIAKSCTALLRSEGSLSGVCPSVQLCKWLT